MKCERHGHQHNDFDGGSLCEKEEAESSASPAGYISDMIILRDLVLSHDGKIDSGLTQDFENGIHAFEVAHPDGRRYRISIHVDEI